MPEVISSFRSLRTGSQVFALLMLFIYQYISLYVHDLWQSEWDTAVNNKLHATKPLIGEQPSAYRSVRRDEVVVSRLKLEHSYLTHSYL